MYEWLVGSVALHVQRGTFLHSSSVAMTASTIRSSIPFSMLIVLVDTSSSAAMTFTLMSTLDSSSFSRTPARFGFASLLYLTPGPRAEPD